MQIQLKKVRSSYSGPGCGRRDDRGQEEGVVRSLPWSESLLLGHTGVSLGWMR